jgi:hypothetical protein
MEFTQPMTESPKEKPPEPKLFTRGKFIILFIIILFGSSLSMIGEYLIKGSVSGVTLGASITAFVIGLIIIVVIGWYANKPER